GFVHDRTCRPAPSPAGRRPVLRPPRPSPRARWPSQRQLGCVPVMGRLPVRRAARVILLDPDDRVLLMRYDDRPPNGSHWTTPGGGLNEAEDYRAAALRELAEETGWSDITLLGEVARRTLTMEYAGRLVRQHERL